MTAWPAVLAALDAATARCSPSTRAALDAAAVRLRAAGAEADGASAAVASALTDAGADASALAAVEAVTGGPFALLSRPLGAVGAGVQRAHPHRLDAGASVLAIPPPVTVEAAGLGAVGLGALLHAAGLRVVVEAVTLDAAELTAARGTLGAQLAEVPRGWASVLAPGVLPGWRIALRGPGPGMVGAEAWAVTLPRTPEGARTDLPLRLAPHLSPGVTVALPGWPVAACALALEVRPVPGWRAPTAGPSIEGPPAAAWEFTGAAGADAVTRAEALAARWAVAGDRARHLATLTIDAAQLRALRAAATLAGEALAHRGRTLPLDAAAVAREARATEALAASVAEAEALAALTP